MNAIIKEISITNLIKNYKIIVPQFQRILNNNKVNEIIDYQKTYKKQYQFFNFLGVLILCKFEDKTTNSNIYYLIDGQHRYQAMKHFQQEFMQEFNVYIQIIPVDHIEKMLEYYNVINKNTPLPDIQYEIVDKEKQILQETINYFQEKYPKDIWSYKPKTRRPRINYNLFQETCVYIYKQLNQNIKSSEVLIDYLEEYNNVLSKRDITSFFKINENMFSMSKLWNFYLGLYSYNYEQDYGFIWAKEIVEYKSGIKIKNKKKETKKQKISKSLSDSVWAKYMGKDHARAYCLICNTNIITINGHDKFQCGHILSEHNGGTISIDNLLPICKTCNVSMGTTHMDEFVKTQFSNNWENYEKRIYRKPLDTTYGNYVYSTM